MMTKRIGKYLYEYEAENKFAVAYLGLEDHIQRTLYVKMKMEPVADSTGRFANLKYDGSDYTAAIFSITEKELVAVLSC